MNIKYTKESVKNLGKMESSARQRIHRAIQGLTNQPPEGDIKRLQGYADGRYRLRVGKNRIVYRFSEDRSTLYIMDIDSRGDIYK